MNPIALYVHALRMRMNHASEALVLDDVGKHLDRMRLFDVIARFLSLGCKHTLETKNPRKTKNLRVYGGFCYRPENPSLSS